MTYRADTGGFLGGSYYGDPPDTQDREDEPVNDEIETPAPATGNPARESARTAVEPEQGEADPATCLWCGAVLSGNCEIRDEHWPYCSREHAIAAEGQV